MLMKVVLNKSNRNYPNCQNFKKCIRKAKTPRAIFCESCFKARAEQTGARSGGNPKGNAGNKGNVAGNAGNKGNTKNGIVKEEAGKRSGLKRSARLALVVKKQWLDKILSGEKDWEIRGSATAQRGWIHFAESKAGGKLVGRARLVDCIELPKSTFKRHVRRHCVTNVSDVPYKHIFAWVLEDPERFTKPFVYKHTPGAVIWVRV